MPHTALHLYYQKTLCQTLIHIFTKITLCHTHVQVFTITRYCATHKHTHTLLRLFTAKDAGPHTDSRLYYHKVLCHIQLHIFTIQRHCAANSFTSFLSEDTVPPTHIHLHVLIIPTNSGRDFIRVHHSYSIAMRLRVCQAHTNNHSLSILYLIPLTVHVTINICFFFRYSSYV